MKQVLFGVFVAVAMVVGSLVVYGVFHTPELLDSVATEPLTDVVQQDRISKVNYSRDLVTAAKAAIYEESENFTDTEISSLPVSEQPVVAFISSKTLEATTEIVAVQQLTEDYSEDIQQVATVSRADDLASRAELFGEAANCLASTIQLARHVVEDHPARDGSNWLTCGGRLYREHGLEIEMYLLVGSEERETFDALLELQELISRGFSWLMANRLAAYQLAGSIR